MTVDDAIRIVRIRWSSDGKCVTCASRAALEAYGELTQAVRMNTFNSAVELPCLSEQGSSHVGVRIRLG